MNAIKVDKPKDLEFITKVVGNDLQIIIKGDDIKYMRSFVYSLFDFLILGANTLECENLNVG